MKLWTDNGRTMEPAYTISSPGTFGSGELKKKLGFFWVFLEGGERGRGRCLGRRTGPNQFAPSTSTKLGA